MKLLGTSYHSVKGGVGRSSLSMGAALKAALENRTQPVYLIDTDFLGTSRADTGTLLAPRWGNVPELRDKVATERWLSVAQGAEKDRIRTMPGRRR